jgi:hypothetical protein
MSARCWLPLCLCIVAACADPFVNIADGRPADIGAEISVSPDYRFIGDMHQYKCADVIDILFVLDVSSSMDFVLDTLDKEIGLVVTASNKLAPDTHLGLLGFVDSYRLDTTGPLEGGKVHTDAATLQQAFRNYKNTYTTPNRNPGDGPSGPTLQNPICEENAVDSLRSAALEFPWRPFANRVVIVATDDTFLERPDNYGDRDGDGKTDKTDYPREGDYPARFTLAEAVSALKQAKVRVFSFTRLQPPGLLDLTRCGTGRRLPWTAISNGWSTPYNAQKPIPEQTAGGNFDIDQVYAGKLSLTATINNVVLESHCKPIE